MGQQQSTQAHDGASQAACPNNTLKVYSVNAMAMEKNILLVGTSGRGKSATGNSIFEDDKFKTSDAMETNHDSIICKSKKIDDNLSIMICDALTLQEERMEKSKTRTDIESRLQKCFEICPEGFHFIIFVFSYTSRITPEETDAVDILKNIFEELFKSKQVVAVFTHGEDFDLHKKRKIGPDFEEWYYDTQDILLAQIRDKMDGMKVFLAYNLETKNMASQRLEILEAIRNCKIVVRRELHDHIVTNEPNNDVKDSGQNPSANNSGNLQDPMTNDEQIKDPLDTPCQNKTPSHSQKKKSKHEDDKPQKGDQEQHDFMDKQPNNDQEKIQE